MLEYGEFHTRIITQSSDIPFGYVRSSCMIQHKLDSPLFRSLQDSGAQISISAHVAVPGELFWPNREQAVHYFLFAEKLSAKSFAPKVFSVSAL
jgi:hypothetical protein